MEIAVYGAGGVGAYYGGRLAEQGHDVTLIARGEHLDALRSDGLTVESVAGDFAVDLPATDDPTAVGEVDLVLFCVKSFDTADAAAALDAMLRPDSAVLSLQNGVDNEDVLADVVGTERVWGGVTYIFSTIKEPGVVEHTGGPAEIVFAEYHDIDDPAPERSALADALLGACEAATGMSADYTEDVHATLWDKFALICAQAGLTATTRHPFGDIRATEETWALYRRVMEEVVAIAHAEGVRFGWDPVTKWLDAMESMDNEENYSSLHYDLTHGKRMELDALHGSAVRHAREHGVDAPAVETIDAILRPQADANES
ncbi:2-dehydropantoate 2-reductase [Halarchaeum acidiphilum MH1-52-1]|uniref:2-dehydropantoate 2-reductase n=1 Tax=Halarchaeum acidiphilum MH1-52-1 TaxID=1261545 RepID=U2YR17_9EURY|nr:2-dehydropantoate 2-reductase [Halarchaeum acidiphilum]GAD51415.1 2-dehydropantoate 2-reductase [Halarchaeum acidiphilum MH1-52-1]